MKRLAILGSTGTIGVNTLQLVAAHPERFSVVALTAGQNVDLLCEQVRQFRPRMVAVLSDAVALELRHRLAGESVEIMVGDEGLKACACHEAVEMVVSAIVGAAGLVPTLAAVEAGKDIALANKETLVTAGELVMAAVARHKVAMLPVDSEHSAIFQSLEGQRREDVRRLILTASGGPFRNHDIEALQQVSPNEALAHPNWSMGRKISIDSATMMNKGLEVIEAHWLFALPPEKIAVHIHPQSIVHSMVEYRDGSVIAQLGIPDMKGPIAYALAYPERLPLDLPPLDLCRLSGLTFDEPDVTRFPCLKLAYEVLRLGGTAPAVLNAANEEAVAAFLDEKIAFLQIPQIVEAALSRHTVVALGDLETALAADAEGRALALETITTFARGVNRC